MTAVFELDSGTPQFFSHKAGALRQARQRSAECEHVVIAYGRVVDNGMSARDLWVALLNGEALGPRVAIAAFRRGRAVPW